MLRAVESDERVMLIPWTKAPKESPVFFSASAELNAQVGLETVTSEQKISYRVHQGKAECLTLGLGGAGEVTEVTGAGLRDWSVRVAENGARFLDLRPNEVDGKYPAELQALVRTRQKVEKDNCGLVLPTPGDAIGFTMSINLTVDPGVELKVTQADGLVPVEGALNRKFVGAGVATLGMKIAPTGAEARGLELTGASLSGKLADDGGSVSFKLTGIARAAGEGSMAELLGGGAALADGVSGDGWHVALRKNGNAWIYDLVAERAGEVPVEMSFDVPVARKGDWKILGFSLPAGVVVPVVLEGVANAVAFDNNLAVVPALSDKHWRGFLPANGQGTMAWHATDKVADGTLFFSSTETTDIRVGSGLLRQLTVMDLRVLQGKLAVLNLTLDGPGEVLSVAGDPVLGWVVKEVAGKRQLEVKLSRPIEGAGRVVIEAQAPLGGFPVKAQALRIAPLGSLRHSGWVRVANDGAVRVEIADAKGLIQLAPGQFPGGVDESLRQVFVYRFPSADYQYTVNATQVLPEVGVTEVTVYELAETDRRVSADLELDIREAPLREWEIEIPADHAVASVTGAQVADYAVGAESKDGKRKLKILFKQAVADRQLVSVRLEKNEAAKAGPWELKPLGFPGVKSRRGYIGAVAAAGYRLTAGKTTGVAEVPVTFFPKKTNGLQQAFRLREDTWTVGLAVEALGQSIQADVFHLYSLKAGAVYGSVLMNFFVVGAPATEWRISVPEEIGNIDVTGQSVGRDWRRDGNTVIVPLSRPVLGAGTLLLSFEQPMNPRGGKLSPGEVRPLGVQGERGFVHVVSPLQVNQEPPVAEGNLLGIDPSELPAEFRLLSSAPTLGAWQYTARDFKISLTINWFKPGDTASQVVDFQKLTSHVSRDGQWVTDARIFVKSRGRSALRMEFPAGSVLWEAKVDGEAVNARADGDVTLVPLPSRQDPNQAVEISLRYGARAENARKTHLAAPKLEAPIIIGQWTVTGDEGRQLVPRGGTADLVKRVLAENGWEWLARHRRGTGLLLLAGLAGLLLGKANPTGVRKILSLVCGLGFIMLAVELACDSAITFNTGSKILEYAAPVVAANGEVSIELGNVPDWAARTSWGAWLGFVLGTALGVWGLARASRWRLGCGLALTVTAFLSIRGGAPLFFGVVALTGLFWCLPRIWQCVREQRNQKVAQAVAVATVMLTIMAPWGLRAAEIPALKPAESMIHDWQIRDGRLYGTVDVTLRGEAGERFLLLREPAVLSHFEGAGLRVTKMRLDSGNAYVMVAENAGRLTGKVQFEMPLADPLKGWNLPVGPAAMRRVTVRWNQGGWEFFSPDAAKTQTLAGLTAEQSGALLSLGPADPVKIQVRPKQRDAGTEETKFFAEVSNLFLPGPGVVNGRHLVTIRPAQGRVTTLTMKVPAGFTVSDVVDGPVGAWRFDPAKRELRITVEPAQNQGFCYTIETQRGAGTLPLELDLEPVRVDAAAGEVGLLGIAFGEDVQPESVNVDGLSRVNPEDFNGNLLPHNKEGQALALLQHAFRYGAGAAKAKLKVTAVAPELRAESWQLVSLGEDRLVIATDLAVTITRSGVFRLDLDVPDGLEIESATGECLSHWSEDKVGGKRVVTFHLSGKTMGRRNFSLTLTGHPTGDQKSWQVPRLSLRDASRETGVLTVVPERGLAGETDVQLEYQRPSAETGGESVVPVVLENTRVKYYVAVRAGGRLELEAGALPRGWQRTDWAVVQSTLGRVAGSVAPTMAFTVADPEGPLPVVLKRHKLAELRKLRVADGSLTTLLSPDGDALTAVSMRMQVIDKVTLRLKLPDKANLFNVFVNDEGATLVRENSDWLFYVFPSPEVGKPTVVRFVYSASLAQGKRLEGPVLDVPMENLTWRVLMPEGWKLAGHGGDFDLKKQSHLGLYRIEDYQSLVRGKHASDTKNAVALLDQANAWLEAGDQEKAGQALGNAVRNGQLDAASGEDARVQLRELKTQQAVVGLNTRRQKLVLDNQIAMPQQVENPQLNRAAEVNPVLRGSYNYDPKQFDRFLEGNTADENTTLKEIANRIVTQQLAAEPAPATLDVTLPERGTVLTFTRSVQVDGQRPMAIELKLKRSQSNFAWITVFICLLTGAMGAMGTVGAKRAIRAKQETKATEPAAVQAPTEANAPTTQQEATTQPDVKETADSKNAIETKQVKEPKKRPEK